MRPTRFMVRMGFVAVGCGSLLLNGVAPASANWAGKSGQTGCDDLNQADNKSHSIYRAELEANIQAAVNWQASNILTNSTLVTPSFASSLTSTTDVVVRDRYYDDYCGYNWWTAANGGVIGAAECDSLTAGDPDCEQHTLRISNVWGDQTSTAQRRDVVSHEMGHTLGLSHRIDPDEASVMGPSAPYTTAFYTNHDLRHLANDLDD